jgi:leucyl aminopeptidase
MLGTYRDYPAPVSTYTLRAANPAKTRCDAVVVGVVQGGKGVGSGPSVAPGGEEVAKEYGRAFRPLLASLGVTGKPGEVTKVPTGKRLSSPLLVLVGLGKVGKGETPSPVAVRRAAGAASRAVTNAASVAIALPADSVELVRAVTEGFLLGGYTYTTYKKKADDESAKVPGDVVVLCASARKKEFGQAFDEAQIVSEAVATTRSWVNTPPATSPRRRSPPRSRPR